MSVSLGNEPDVWLEQNPTQVEPYLRFLGAVADRVREQRPGLPLTVKVTADAFLSDDPLGQRLLESADIVSVTYYPLDDGFRVLPPDHVHQTFSNLALRAGSRPVHVAEIGYPSSSLCGSSEVAQTSFLQNGFQAWDRHVEVIERLHWPWQTDLSSEAAQDYASQFGIADPCFEAFLGSLGLRDHRARPKPAWEALEVLRGIG